jgi:hypothetical protein
MEPQSTFRTEALRRYPTATLCNDGPWGVVLNGGHICIEMFRTYEDAKKFAGGGFRIENFGPKVEPRPFRHKMDTEED